MSNSDFPALRRTMDTVGRAPGFPVPSRRRLFVIWKSGFDKTIALICLLPLALACLVLLVLNSRYNPGPLFFTQTRMGRHGKPFRMIKLRTMMPKDAVPRGHADGVETSRITPLGAVLRKYRIDELPNMLNVLRGEMSVIGPRPDVWEHADRYCSLVPGYRRRLKALPGITGLAQVKSGYAEGVDQTMLKARYDMLYIRRMGFRTDLWITLATLRVILSGFGAR